MSQFEQLERLRFFTGQLLTLQDLQLEQDYFRGKTRRHNRFLHGWGIVAGLGISLHRGTTVIVEPGLALDCAGNELVLPAPERLSLSGLKGRKYITINYTETLVEPLPSLQGKTECSRVLEAVTVEFASANPVAAHARVGPGTPGCGRCHPLSLGTVSRRGTRWQVAPARHKTRRHR